jgi:hypothetical protein
MMKVGWDYTQDPVIGRSGIGLEPRSQTARLFRAMMRCGSLLSPVPLPLPEPIDTISIDQVTLE